MSATPERREQRREDTAPDVPAHPSLGAPPRRDRARPVFRSSQLDDGAGEEGEPDGGGKLRG